MGQQAAKEEVGQRADAQEQPGRRRGPHRRKVCLKGSKSGAPMTKANDTADPTQHQLGCLLLQILTFGSRRV